MMNLSEEIDELYHIKHKLRAECEDNVHKKKCGDTCPHCDKDLDYCFVHAALYKIEELIDIFQNNCTIEENKEC